MAGEFGARHPGDKACRLTRRKARASGPGTRTRACASGSDGRAGASTGPTGASAADGDARAGIHAASATDRTIDFAHFNAR